MDKLVDTVQNIATQETKEIDQQKTCEYRGFTLWLTGLSGAGKSTIAQRISEELAIRKIKHEVLDGDVIRTNLSKGLGFSREDRNTNIRRIGFVCNLLSRNGIVAVTAAISPYQSIREENRKLIDNFVEVYVKCPLEICEARDVKGLYKKARAGEIREFTGISDPYEEPVNPEVICETNRESVEDSVEKILYKLKDLDYILYS